MLALSPLFKISYRASTLCVPGIIFCTPVFSAGEESVGVSAENLIQDTQQIKEQANPPTAKPETTSSSDKQKTIGDHFLSLNPFKKNNKENEGDQEPSALFPNKDGSVDIDIPNLIDQAHKVQDLAYGEILLDYYTNNNFDALIRARIAQDQNELQKNSQHVELLLAQLYILEGLPKEAEAALKRIDIGRVSDQTRNRALFQLARINLYQGDLDSAKRILESEIGKLNGSLELERKSLLTNIYSAQNNKEAIDKILLETDSNLTRNAYIKYNLASAGIFSGNEDFALPILLELSTSDHVDLESRSLKDQVNLNLGLYYLKQEKLAEAKQYFNLVS